MSPSSTTGFLPKRLLLFNMPKTPPPGQTNQRKDMTKAEAQFQLCHLLSKWLCTGFAKTVRSFVNCIITSDAELPDISAFYCFPLLPCCRRTVYQPLDNKVGHFLSFSTIFSYGTHLESPLHRCKCQRSQLGSSHRGQTVSWPRYTSRTPRCKMWAPSLTGKTE